jgi:hypothetical protein
MTINVGSTDRIVRIILGLALIAAYFFMALGTWGWVALVVGIVMLATGVLRVCPAYLPFGINTCQRN